MTPFLFNPSKLQMDWRVRLSMPEVFTNRTEGSGSSGPLVVEAMLVDLTLQRKARPGIRAYGLAKQMSQEGIFLMATGGCKQQLFVSALHSSACEL